MAKAKKAGAKNVLKDLSLPDIEKLPEKKYRNYMEK
jgi:hypothetical protein